MDDKSEIRKKYIPDSMNSYAYYLLPQISIFLRPPPPSLEKPFPQKSHSSLFLPPTRPVPWYWRRGNELHVDRTPLDIEAVKG
jgi:hypothetical protein